MIPRVLVTAFEPYDQHSQNSSWLAMMALTRDLPQGHAVTTRRYPVDFDKVRDRLAKDLSENYDLAIHLGQAPGSAQIRIEMVGLNIRGEIGSTPGAQPLLEPDGPAAYMTSLPVADWRQILNQQGIPAQVSFHAGTYLCNAALYWSHYFSERLSLKTQSVFVHLPLDPAQVAQKNSDQSSLPAQLSANAVMAILNYQGALSQSIAPVA